MYIRRFGSFADWAFGFSAYYNAGTVALIVVLIAVALGTILYCRSRRSSSGRTSRISLRPSRDGYVHDGVDYANGGLAEESIPLNPSAYADGNGNADEEESRRRKGKGKGKVVTFEAEETVFEVGSDDEQKHP